MVCHEVTVESQSTLRDFLEKMPPSLKFTVLTFKFETIMKFNNYFSDN